MRVPLQALLLHCSLAFQALASTTQEKRQVVTGGNGLINQTLGSVQGILGLNATFDYVVVGAGTVSTKRSLTSKAVLSSWV